jgi:hypothetical protein
MVFFLRLARLEEEGAGGGRVEGEVVGAGGGGGSSSEEVRSTNWLGGGLGDVPEVEGESTSIVQLPSWVANCSEVDA